MDSDNVVATVVVVGATVLGAIQLYRNGDGAVLSAVAAIWGTVLGYVFGKKTASTTP